MRWTKPVLQCAAVGLALSVVAAPEAAAENVAFEVWNLSSADITLTAYLTLPKPSRIERNQSFCQNPYRDALNIKCIDGKDAVDVYAGWTHWILLKQ